MSPDGEGITRWRRVADDIRSHIGDGIISDVLPSELELAARYGVNRHTVRRAIAALTADGLLRVERGRGTFVNTKPHRHTTSPSRQPLGCRWRSALALDILLFG